MNVHRAVAAALTALILSLLWLPVATSFADAQPASDKQAVIAVKGLACPFCVHGLKKQLRRLPGVKNIDVSLGRGQAVVTFDGASKVTNQQIARAVRKAGFTPGKIEWRGASGS